MKIYNIIIKENEQQAYTPLLGSGEKSITFSLANESQLVSADIAAVFRDNKIEPGGPAADLAYLAVSVYTADQIISRENDGYQGWSRHIRIHFPVADKGLWDRVKGSLEDMLCFLSGDKWDLVFRQQASTKSGQTQKDGNPNQITKVSLFSGGIDSLIGAIDLLESNEKVAFVSHYKRGTEGSKQPKLIEVLKNQYGNGSFFAFRFYVQPKQKHSLASKEDTSRARSFLFLSLGLAVANALGDAVDLIVPENGLISLNVPLTQTRLSSHSTRTTHPHYLSTFREVASALGINNRIVNPYRFKTKGEMMSECRNKHVLQHVYSQTISCSHPDISRRVKGSSPGIHCGYCVPCIIRQAAEKAAGITQTRYAHQIKYNPPSHEKRKGRDLRAFKMALEEIKDLPPHSMVLRLLKSGPLPFSDRRELNEYLGVYERGMGEVNNFLR